VQINVQIQPEKRRINIVDVLKPTDDVLAQLTHLSQLEEDEEASDEPKKDPPPPPPAVTEQVIMKNESELELPIPTFQISRNVQEVPATPTPPPIKLARDQIRPTPFVKRVATVSVEKKPPIKMARPTVVTPSEAPKKKNVIRWFVDSNFKQDQIRLKFPESPEDWSAQHVQHWLKWAMRQFHLGYVKLHEWNLNGKELCAMTIQEFQRRIPNDPNDIFWTHLELLRKCKFVATIQKMPATDEVVPQVLEPQPTIHKKVYRVGDNMEEPVQGNLIGNRTGNNGQVQLWQFLLELLTSKEHREVIQWSGNEGEFKLLNAEVVAQLWGEKKHKTTMTYEKLSRALRYYYDGDMISKVNGKR
jgi:GA-binding protein transcription factor, alpha